MFKATQIFTALQEIIVYHRSGRIPNVVVVVTNDGQHVIPQTISHNEYSSTITLQQQETGTVTVSVSNSRVGTIRTSPDGTDWALLVTNNGNIKAVRVPTDSLSLESHITARVVELETAVFDLACTNLQLFEQARLAHLLADADINNLTNRKTYLQTYTTWLDSVLTYQDNVITAFNNAVDLQALNTITWTLDAFTPPDVTIIGALAIND